MPDTMPMNLTQEQSLLEQSVSRLGGMCEAQLINVAKALESRDADLARTVIAEDESIDALRENIEDQAVSIIARRAPAPFVLRGLVGAMRIAGHLERIGDHSKNIGKRITAIEYDTGNASLVKSVAVMADLALLQLKTVLNSYGQKNDALALEVWRQDEKIDSLYTSIFRELLTYMMEDPRKISFCTHLLFCAKNIERIGDHCTNIAESVHYILKADKFPQDRPKGDTTSFSNVPLPGDK